MTPSATSHYQVLADAVLALHVGVVVFVVGGLAWVLVGYARGWPLARSLGFRLLHLACIAIVVAESLLGMVCPLTTLEMWLRMKAKTDTYSGSFIQHWLQQLLYHNAPAWVFTTAYCVFGLAVVATWFWCPPQARRGTLMRTSTRKTRKPPR